jgi:ATP-binding cassette subfamily C protein CydCD
VLAVLLGLVEPSGGRVTVDDVDLGDLEPAAWRSRLAWVPQRPSFLAGSVADNLRVARPGATETQMRQALASAGLVGALGGDGGLERTLGQGAAGLSAGERHRLALARAFLGDAPLVLLDEPTAHLDSVTEGQVAQAVRRLAQDRTVVMVTHRPAMLRLADAVVALHTPGADPASPPVLAETAG